MSNRPVAKNKAAARSGAPRKQNYGYSSQGTGPSTQSRPLALWIALGALGVAAIVAIVVAAAAGDGGSTEEVTQPVTVSGTRLPAVPESQTPIIANDPAAGMTIPKLVGKSFDGTATTIQPGGGPQLIAFIAHWCSHCQAEVPRLVQYLADGTIPSTLRVAAVSTAADRTRGNYPPASWLEKESWEEPVMADDAEGTAGQAFGLGGFPYLLAVDADGKVVKRSSGELTQPELEEMVAAALGTGAVAPA